MQEREKIKCFHTGEMQMKYSDLNEYSMDEVSFLPLPRIKPPLSVHMPLNPPFFDSLVYCDCAFNVCRYPILPGCDAGDPESRRRCSELHLNLLSFAFGEVPFVPEFRQSSWSRPDDGIPAVRGELNVHEMHYILEYFCDPDDGSLWIRGTASNTSLTHKTAVFHCKASAPLESQVFDYHYVPFRWNALRWNSAGDAVTPPAVIDAGKYEVTACEHADFSSSNPNSGFGCSHPYYGTPEMALLRLDGTLKLSVELEPGEKESFTLHDAFGKPGVRIPAADFEGKLASARAFWHGLAAGHASADFGNAEDNRRFLSLQFCSLQLLLKLDGFPDFVLQPCQGGNSERFYVWVWEAMEMLRPMLVLGWFEPVRKVLKFIFSLQDGGHPPKGEFTSLAGAVGTTGPRWANTTGAALLLASDYLKYSGDADFAAEYLPKMVRAAQWILGETAATRRYNPDGSKVLNFGLMPKACATDGDYGYIFVVTDSWNCAGVERMLSLPEVQALPEYKQLEEGCRNYRDALNDAIDSMRRPDGFIARSLSSEGVIAPSFYAIAGAVQLLSSGFAFPDDPRIKAYLDYHERHVCDRFFCAPMFDGVKYIGNMEHTLHRAWLRLGEWKKAKIAARVFRECGMTHDLDLTQERCSEFDDSFTPWQPNASGNGRFLQMLVDDLVLETPANREILLLGGVFPSNFRHSSRFMLKDVHLDSGTFSLNVEHGMLDARWSKPLEAGVKIRLPEHFRFDCASGALEKLPGNFWKVTEAVSGVRGKIALETSPEAPH